MKLKEKNKIKYGTQNSGQWIHSLAMQLLSGAQKVENPVQ